MTDQTTCTACGADIGRDAEGRLPAQCPACGELLIVDDQEVDEPADRPEPEPIDEMEEVRIRRIVRERRAMVRTVGYHMVGVLACIIVAVQLAVRFLTADSATAKIGYAAATILLVMLGWTLLGRYRDLKARAYSSALEEPTRPPDFSGLSDGSQHIENLKRVGREGK